MTSLLSFPMLLGAGMPTIQFGGYSLDLVTIGLGAFVVYMLYQKRKTGGTTPANPGDPTNPSSTTTLLDNPKVDAILNKVMDRTVDRLLDNFLPSAPSTAPAPNPAPVVNPNPAPVTNPAPVVLDPNSPDRPLLNFIREIAQDAIKELGPKLLTTILSPSVLNAAQDEAKKAKEGETV